MECIVKTDWVMWELKCLWLGGEGTRKRMKEGRSCSM